MVTDERFVRHRTSKQKFSAYLASFVELKKKKEWNQNFFFPFFRFT